MVVFFYCKRVMVFCVSLAGTVVNHCPVAVRQTIFNASRPVIR